jgi:ketosteroid isomerase-like protein
MIENSRTTDEAQIRLLLGAWVSALRVKDIDKILSLYSPEVVTFDVVPPLQYVGTQTYGKSFRRMFNAFRGPIDFETRDLCIAVGTDVAFSHSLVRTVGTTNSGHKTDRWLRRTVCFHKVSGKWLITHEHVSLPVDPESGNAVQDLQP